MEKTLKSDNDKEFMRIAMLKHEETFRQQVNELHRLYRIQKILMESSSGLNNQLQQKQQQEQYNLVESSKSAFTIDHYQQQLILQQQAQIQRGMINNININDKSKIMGLSLMRPSNNQAHGPRSSVAQQHIAESNDGDKMSRLEESEVELTLSLGPSSFNPTRKMGKSESNRSISSSSTGSTQTKKTNTENDNRMITTWGTFPQGSGIEPGFSSAQQSNNPPWLYQALSLKLT